MQDTVSEHPERFFVAEIIREKIFQQYREEIPYCSSVRLHPSHSKYIVMQPPREAGSAAHMSSLVPGFLRSLPGVTWCRVKRLMTASHHVYDLNHSVPVCSHLFD